MTAKQVQIRRDTATNLNAAAPAEGELGYDKTNKRTVVGDGVTPGGIKNASAKDVQNQPFIYGTVGGTADAITLTNSPAVASYSDGLCLKFKATGTNTGAVTVAVDSIGGTKNIKKMLDGSIQALSAGDIVSGGTYQIEYDGTQFQLKGLGVTSAQPSGLVYLGTYTASNSATLDLTSKMSSTYDDYVLIFNNIIPATNTANLLLRTSTDNGANFDASASDYIYALQLNDAVSGPTNPNSTSATSIMIGSSITNSSVLGLSGEIKIFNVNSTTVRKFVSGDVSYIGSGGGTHITSGRIAGLRDSTEVNLDAIRLLMSSGNISSGTVKIYGISKS
jgi:hypothetical protein